MQLESPQPHDIQSSRMPVRSGRYNQRNTPGYPIRKASAEQLPAAPEPQPYPTNHIPNTPLASTHVTTNIVHGDVSLNTPPNLPNPPPIPPPMSAEQNGIDQTR